MSSALNQNSEVSPKPSRSSSLSLAWAPAALFLIALSITLASRVSVESIWDDAYMFARYADQLIERGSLSFNPGQTPAYGLTSIASALVVTVTRALGVSSIPLALSLSSVMCGLLWIAALLRLVSQSAQLATDHINEISSKPKSGLMSHRMSHYTVKWIAVTLIAASLYWARESVVTHLTSGMDTTLALLTITLYLSALQRMVYRSGHEASGAAVNHARMIGCGLLGGLCYAVRPDLLIYSFGIPAALTLTAQTREARARWMMTLTVSGVTLTAQLIACQLYFGSALPLPFYAKSLNLYGDFIKEKYAYVSIRQLLSYSKSLPLIALTLLGALALAQRARAGLGSWLEWMGPLERSVALTTLIFTGYYALGVSQIMYYAQRFYYPTLPALCVLTVYALAYISDRLKQGEGAKRRLGRVSAAQAWQLCAVITLSLSLSALSQSLFDAVERVESKPPHFDLVAHYRAELSDYWARLDQVAALPDDLVIATSEVGYPSALNPKQTIIDLVGLNETSIALHGFDPERLLARYRPDWIYMPNPDYKTIRRALEESAQFKERYELFSAERLGGRMGVAIRRESAHYQAMRAIIGAP